ncbi:MAG: exonuclease domain-containing protein [Patescibacteria group bacterium]
MRSFTDKTFAIVDVETTGGSPVFDRVIEIGILRVENGEIVETFRSFIDPEKPLPPSIERITGIHTEDLVSAPLFEDVAHKVGELLGGAIFVAHNARFDYGFLKNELKRCGISLNEKCLCTVRLSRKLYPGERKHDLSTVIERHGLVCENRHRAFDDARVLYDFVRTVEDQGRIDELHETVRLLLKENTLPQFLNEDSVRTLPEGPGVYTFYGPEDEILYIGKSRGVRHRVLSHFSNDHAAGKEMELCQQTVRVEAVQCAGELSALLLESKMIKDLSPIYNRMLRRQSELVVAKKTEVGKYYGVTLERIKGIEPEEYANVLGIFKSVRQAKEFLSGTREEHGLCGKLLGLENTKGACFYSQLGMCDGACTGIADHNAYNKRVSGAFKARSIKAWPFAGPIIIEERVDDLRKHSFVLDNWCLLKDIKTDEDDVREETLAPAFDHDSYKIFLRYIQNPLHKKRITVLKRNEYEALSSVYMGHEYVIS